MMRRIIMIIVIIIAFCLGTQWGEMKSESRGDANFRGEKMMWGYNTKDYVNNPNLQKGSGSVTVDVKAPVAAPTPAQ